MKVAQKFLEGSERLLIEHVVVRAHQAGDVGQVLDKFVASDRVVTSPPNSPSADVPCAARC